MTWTLREGRWRHRALWKKCILGRGHASAKAQGCNLLGMFEKKAWGPSELGVWEEADGVREGKVEIGR